MSSDARLRGVLAYVIEALVRDGQLELVPGAQIASVVDRVAVEIADAGAFAQAGSTISRALVRCDLVEELYADDTEILSLLNYMVG